MSAPGPTLTTWTVQQVGSYLTYTGRDANVVVKPARDPKRPLPGLSTACIGSVAVLASPAKIASPKVGATVQGGDQ
jgi:hypothetical protein